MSTKRITRLALFTALALIISLLESLLPPLLVPGAKLGLSNVVILTAIIILGNTDALIVQIARCLLSALVIGGLNALMFSLPAGIISLALMAVMFKWAYPKLSLMGISFVGAVAHNIVQVFVASLVVEDIGFLIALPQYILVSIAAGLFVGIATFLLVKYLPARVYIDR